VTAVGSSNLAFDHNGDTTTDDQGHTLIYDAWNRLVAVKNGGTTLDAYGYDALGQRVTENPGTLRDIYFSQAWQVLEEDIAGAMQNQYVWSPVYADAMIERDTPSQRLYVQHDGNWDLTALVNTSGNVVERYVYDSYGAVTYLNASWGTISGTAYSWIYQFQGGRLDTATGLYNFRHRDHSPALGRWMELDPMQFSAGDTDLYRYVANRPLDATDPSGLRLELLDKRVRIEGKIADLDKTTFVKATPYRDLVETFRERFKENFPGYVSPPINDLGRQVFRDAEKTVAFAFLVLFFEWDVHTTGDKVQIKGKEHVKQTVDGQVQVDEDHEETGSPATDRKFYKEEPWAGHECVHRILYKDDPGTGGAAGKQTVLTVKGTVSLVGIADSDLTIDYKLVIDKKGAVKMSFNGQDLPQKN
jgi:RHS repeat-associated protein